MQRQHSYGRGPLLNVCSSSETTGARPVVQDVHALENCMSYSQLEFAHEVKTEKIIFKN